MTAFDMSAYLERIGQASVPVTRDGLAELQGAQIRAIPFENIDVLVGRTPTLDLDGLFRKTVVQGRGGYCFELNSLLHQAMLSLGFQVRRSLARVRMGAPAGGARGHLALPTEIDGRRYLVDAGFGGPGPLAPLDIDTTDEQIVPNGTYRITDDPDSGEKVVERRTEAGWFPIYGFDDAHVSDADIKAGNYLSANWNALPFVHHLMLGGYSGDERIGVFDRSVTIETPTATQRREFADFLDFSDILVGRLGLKLEHETLQYLWERIRVGAADEISDGVA
jgi:N-hydroxyarylamine O-acetyltransferase